MSYIKENMDNEIFEEAFDIYLGNQICQDIVNNIRAHENEQNWKLKDKIKTCLDLVFLLNIYLKPEHKEYATLLNKELIQINQEIHTITPF